ncbi:MAG: transcription antitermination factor NusB [Candidatus Obscuribacterales bacterium]|nr:transcription antitermination factor NusB [Candidatus Obscuribacterales bacterium]
MSARRIARELAVIVMPQLPKSPEKLSAIDLEELAAKAVHMLRDNAKHVLADVDSFLAKGSTELNEIEFDHPANAKNVHSEDMVPVKLTTGQLKEQIENLERALNMVAEALDIPDMVLSTGRTAFDINCRHCGQNTTAYMDRPEKSDVQEFFVRLVSTYNEHRSEIDEFIKNARAKWNVDRMVSIDRDILRLACAEALYMTDVPLRVCFSEAVELCHRFADEKAAKFINGILGDLSKQAGYFRANGKFAENLDALPEIEDFENVEETDSKPVKR